VSNVLFVCVANSGRSVLAERLFRRHAGGRHEARSAGSAPGAHVAPGKRVQRRSQRAEDEISLLLQRRLELRQLLGERDAHLRLIIRSAQ